MTFKQIQEQMNIVFEAIGRLSTELAKAKESLQKLLQEENKYKEGVQDSSDAYNLVKNRSDVVHLPTFRNAKNNKEDVSKIYEEDVSKIYEDVKLKVLVDKAQVDILERDLKIYKDKYSELEDRYQNHDNTLRFVNAKREEDKPN